MDKISPFVLKQYFTGIDAFFIIDEFYPFLTNRLNETAGVPSFFVHLVTKILNEIIEFEKHYKNDKDTYNTIAVDARLYCKCFDTVYVTVNHTDSDSPFGGEYVPSNFSKTNNITIKMSIPENSSGRHIPYNIIVTILYHELLHAYEDKLLYTKYRISLKDKMEDDCYGLWIYVMNNKSTISSITYNFAFLMYFLNKDEMNANIAQIEADCLNFIDDVNDAKDAMKFFKTTYVYKKMKYIENQIYEINSLSDSDENVIIDDINNLVKNDNLTFDRKDFNAFKKQLMLNWTKYQHKFRVNSSKIICKLFNERTTIK